MAKKSKKVTPSKRATPASIQRDRVRVQREVVTLLNRYASLTKKLAGDIPPLPPLWQGAFEKALSSSKGPLPLEILDRALRDLESASRQLIQSVRVAYLGPPYSYSYLAAIKHFGAGVQRI